MKVTRKGNTQKPCTMVGECGNCGTEVECARREASHEVVYLLFWPAHSYTVHCPTCGDTIGVKKEK